MSNSGDTFALTAPGGTVFHVRPGSRDCETVSAYWGLGKAGYNIEGFRISDGDVVVDVGAHIGAVSLRMATAAKNVTVYALEPFPQNFGLLEKNIRENNLHEVVIPYRLAVNSVGGKKQLFVCTERADAHTFYPHEDFQFEGAIEVDCINLTKFLSGEGIERVDFLKMDAEGAEYDVFLEGDISFLEKVEKIGMECHPCHPKYESADIVRILEGNSFHVTDRGGDLFAKKP